MILEGETFEKFGYYPKDLSHSLGKKVLVECDDVTYNKQTCCDNSIPLFVPLCQKHHSMTLKNRNSWQEFFEISLCYLTDNKCYYSKEEYGYLKRNREIHD